MVALVLQAAGQQTTAIDFQHAAIQLGQAGFHEFRTGHIGAKVTYAQAAFGKEILLAVGLKLGVDEHQRHDAAQGLLLAIHHNHFRLGSLFLIFWNIDDNQTDIEPHLRGSKADALSSVHGFEHVLYQGLKFIINMLHRGTYCPEDGVAVLSYVQKHGGSSLRGYTQLHYFAGRTAESQAQTDVVGTCRSREIVVYRILMETRPTGRECWLVYLLGALFAFVVMRFGFGPASQSMHLRPEYDLNIYYLIGRGWFAGRIPYLELTDIKGPLVFLLHGAGVSLTPGSFLGACLLESLLLGVGGLFAYRSVRLFYSAAVSAGVLGVYSVSMLYFSLHPAELVWVLQHIALYYLLRYGRAGQNPGLAVQCALGGSVGLVLLVKFNLAAFWVPFCIWGIVAAGRNWWRAFLGQTLGVALPLGLAVIYFYQSGALGAMWREYVGIALQYGAGSWAESMLAVRGWRLAAELVPLHLHQAVPEVLAALLGVLSLIPCLFLSSLPGVRGSRRIPVVILASFVLLLVANYGGSRCYIHYAFNFSVYLLLGILVVARMVKPAVLWLGGGAALAGITFAVGLPVVVKILKSHNGNAEMNLVSQELAARIASEQDLLVLDVESALHLYRLSGAQPLCTHFIPSMVPGGWEQHRRELASCIRELRPRYVLSTSGLSGVDAAMPLEKYRSCGHASLGLPAFPVDGKYTEFVLYVRVDE